MNWMVCKVNPNDLRFTQRSIANHFREPFDDVYLEEAREQIEMGLLDPSVFTPIEVYTENGIFWCKNNRRLWVFGMAGVNSIQIKLFFERDFKVPPPPAKQEMARPDYFPKLRGNAASTSYGYC
eukprot:Gb_14480 [translate_table: standard]